MPNLPVKRGSGYRVRWKHRGTREWQSFTLSKFETDRDNKRAAEALYTWLRERNDAVLATDAAIQQYAFLRPAEPLYRLTHAPTFGAVAEEMISSKTHVSQRTQRRQRGQLKNHFGEWLALAIDEISESMVSARASAIKAYAKGWSYPVYMSLAKSVFNRAVEDGHIDKSPARRLIVGKVDESEFDIMTREEFEVLLSACECEQTRNMMVLMIQTGCRIGEVFALRVGDLKVVGPNPHVYVRRSFGQWREENPPKGRKKRVVTLDRGIAAYFAKVIEGRGLGELVFPGLDGGGWFYAYWRLTRWLPTVAKAVENGFDQDRIKIRPHGLRHTHGSWLLSEGVDIRVVSERLGHSDPAFTLRKYIHTTVRGNERMQEVLTQQSGWLSNLAVAS